jgi:hypothetical protein
MHSRYTAFLSAGLGALLLFGLATSVLAPFGPVVRGVGMGAGPVVAGRSASPGKFSYPAIGSYDIEFHSSSTNLDVYRWFDGAADTLIQWPINLRDMARVDVWWAQPTLSYDGFVPPYGGMSDVYMDVFGGLVDSLRAYNPDIMVFQYTYAFGFPKAVVDGGGWTPSNQSIMAKFVKMCYDNDFFARDVSGNRVESESIYWLMGFGEPAIADSLADFWAREWAQSSNSRDYTGFIVDYLDWPDQMDWPCAGGCSNVVDLDQDGIPYGSDPDETIIYQTFVVEYLTKLRERMEYYHGNGKVLITLNGGAWRSASVGPLVDIAILEHLSESGNNVYNTFLAQKESYFDSTFTGRLNHDVIDPMIVMDYKQAGYVAAGRSIALSMLVPNGIANADSYHVGLEDSKRRNLYSYSWMDRDLWASIGNPIGLATMSGDTATRVFENGLVRMYLGTSYTNPYMVEVGGDTIASFGW